jgi:hypothetical protein
MPRSPSHETGDLVVEEDAYARGLAADEAEGTLGAVSERAFRRLESISVGRDRSEQV